MNVCTFECQLSCGQHLLAGGQHATVLMLRCSSKDFNTALASALELQLPCAHYCMSFATGADDSMHNTTTNITYYYQYNYCYTAFIKQSGCYLTTDHAHNATALLIIHSSSSGTANI
jgi:hypothetical protein